MRKTMSDFLGRFYLMVAAANKSILISLEFKASKDVCNQKLSFGSIGF